MRDPERLLDGGTKLDARLLASAVDEPPPPELLGRTLDFLATAPAPGPPAAPPAAVGGSAKAGGLLGAVGIGATLGLLVVAGFELTQPSAPPPPPRRADPVVAAPPSAVVAVPPPRVDASARGPAPSALPAPSAPRASTLAAELALLDEARAALRTGDRAAARALLDRYAREIPRGQLGREAALLRAKVDAGSGGAPTETNP